MKAVKLGGQWLCSEADFQQFLKEQTEAALCTSVRSDEATDEELRKIGLL